MMGCEDPFVGVGIRICGACMRCFYYSDDILLINPTWSGGLVNILNKQHNSNKLSSTS